MSLVWVRGPWCECPCGWVWMCVRAPWKGLFLRCCKYEYRFNYVGRLLKPGEEPSEYTDEEDTKDHSKQDWTLNNQSQGPSELQLLLLSEDVQSWVAHLLWETLGPSVPDNELHCGDLNRSIVCAARWICCSCLWCLVGFITLTRRQGPNCKKVTRLF